MALPAHVFCYNKVHYIILVTGGDDRRVLLWNLEEGLHNATQPMAMRAQHISNIFCLSYDSKNTKIFSAGNDDQVIVHDTKTLVIKKKLIPHLMSSSETKGLSLFVFMHYCTANYKTSKLENL